MGGEEQPMGHGSFDSYRAERTSKPGFDQAAYDAGREQAGRGLARMTASEELSEFVCKLAETYELTELDMVKLLADEQGGLVSQMLRNERGKRPD